MGAPTREPLVGLRRCMIRCAPTVVWMPTHGVTIYSASTSRTLFGVRTGSLGAQRVTYRVKESEPRWNDARNSPQVPKSAGPIVRHGRLPLLLDGDRPQPPHDGWTRLPNLRPGLNQSTLVARDPRAEAKLLLPELAE